MQRTRDEGFNRRLSLAGNFRLLEPAEIGELGSRRRSVARVTVSVSQVPRDSRGDRDRDRPGRITVFAHTALVRFELFLVHLLGLPVLSSFV